MQPQICRNFQAGKCTRGDECSYIHGTEKEVERVRRVCVQFSKAGTCPRAECQFAHEPLSAHEQKVLQSLMHARSESRKRSKSTGKGRAKGSASVCLLHMGGRCDNGASCGLLHPRLEARV